MSPSRSRSFLSQFNEEAYDDDGEDELYPDSNQADEEVLIFLLTST